MANIVFKKTRITGTLGDCLDVVDGATLTDGDFAFVTYLDKVYVYTYDATASGTEVYPTRITPNTNAGDGRWILLVTNDRDDITATDTELNLLDGLTASTAELNMVAGVSAGTATASKVMALGTNKEVDTIAIAEGGLKIGWGAGVAMTCSADELNKMAGVATTAAELGYVSGVTSAIQTQLNALAAIASPVFTGFLKVGTQVGAGNGTSFYNAYYAGPPSNVSGYNLVVNTHSIDKKYMVMSAPITGKRFTHIVTGSGLQYCGIMLYPGTVTWDGTNNVATFDSSGTAYIDAVAISATRYLVLKSSNVTFSYEAPTFG